ncbi:MAG: 3,4-dihydroxy-2-butanone-4-phosphate synthase [Phycisphaerae bacterium]|nr:3,4-dihydroxy-2-butanone-4-phosphate synthase [Phycisphaerae bacterium]
MPFSPIPEILDELRAGRMVVLTDDESRENEGDLVLPAQCVTPEAIAFMLKEAMGYLCLSLTQADCDRLDLVPQAALNTTARGTAFTVSIDGHPRLGFTTGVSARERAKTILHAIRPDSSPADFVRPGHVNPLRARDGGVLVRTGQTEGSVDLCRLAGLHPAAVIIEIMREDGEMARVPDLEKFCAKHRLRMCSVAQVIAHRLERESLVRRLEPVLGRPVRTPLGVFTGIAYESLVDPLPHMALVMGQVGRLDGAGHPIPVQGPTLVRMHRRHLLGDIFDDLESVPGASYSSGQLLHGAMRAIARAGEGAIVYLRSTTPPAAFDAADLAARMHSVRRHDRHPDDPDFAHLSGDPAAPTAPPPGAQPHRDHGIGGQILRDLGLSNLRVLTNAPKPMPGIEAFGVHVSEYVPIQPAPPPGPR